MLPHQKLNQGSIHFTPKQWRNDVAELNKVCVIKQSTIHITNNWFRGAFQLLTSY